MHKHFLLVLLLSIPLFFACRKKEIAKTVGDSTSTTELKSDAGGNKNSKRKIKYAIVDPETDMANTGHLYAVDSIKVTNDTLSIFIEYSGCKEHSFDLYSNGMYAKSLPPKLTLCLRHHENDGCRMLQTEELKFNISNLKYAGKSTVILKLGDKSVNYTSK